MTIDVEFAKYKDLLLTKKCLLHLAIVRRDGTPHLTPLWFSMTPKQFEDRIICFNTAKGRVKAHLLRKGTKCSMTVVDPSNMYRYIGLEGEVEEIIEGEIAENHFKDLVQKYVESGQWRYRSPEEERLMYKVRVHRTFGSYYT